MNLRLLSLLSFVTLLFAFAPVVSAQDQAKQIAPKLTPYFLVKPAPKTLSPAAAKSTLSSAGLPLFQYTTTSSRDGNTYSGVIVGNNPFGGGGGTANVVTQIVPLIIVTHSIATGLDEKGNFSTRLGETTFDSTQHDTACLGPNNNVPVALVLQSPILRGSDFNFGGTDVGKTQYIDAFQRANFWDVIDRDTYHLKLKPKKLRPIVLSIAPKDGLALPPSVLGIDGCAPLGIVNIFGFDNTVVSQLLPALAAQGVNLGTFPIFLLSNVGLSIGTPTSIFNCCALGYHGATETGQTYSPSDFDVTGLFGAGAQDTAVLSHEVGEWANDPLGNNPTPAWGHTGQVGSCQNNLEVGDPLTGTLIPPVTMPNGFTYHLQELAFFSWFYGAPSIGVNGWFSDNGTFQNDAGTVCVQ